MKKLNNIVLSVFVIVTVVSCVKYDPLDFNGEKPEAVLVQEDLNSYEALKSFINRSTNPNFHLGVALSLSPYVNKDVIYRLANRNFDEIVLGYEMKHGAVVQNNGSLNLANVENLLATAREAGMKVYGHTLCWHANQNATYLNKLIEPIIIPGNSEPTWDLVTGANFETSDASNYQSNTNAVLSFTAVGGGSGNTGRALKITNESVRTNDWDAQFFLTFSPAVQEGEQYEFSMDVRADANVSFGTQAHVVPYSYKHYDFFGTVSATTSWANYKKTITVTSAMAAAGAIAFNLGKNATNYYFDNITLKKYNEQGSGSAGYAYTFTNPSATNFWSAQVAHDLSPALENGKEYTLRFVAKGSVAGNIRAELQSTSDYSSNSFGTFSISPQWNEYELKVTTNKGDRNRFVISYGDYVGTVSIDNVKLMVEGGSNNLIPTSDFESGTGAWTGWGNNSTRKLSDEGGGYGGARDQIIEKTPAEKDSILTAALENWISGMMGVAKSDVKAWDVVNEPMDDGRPYELKTGVGKANMAADEFYWQDYLGKDYAVKAFNLARQYGNPTDIHFINDYNLEYNLDKCRGLIEYAEYIEGKGAKVDGIGTQMHININTNKENIAEMFRLLAATGKLIKVSELDIGLGGVKTADATTEQYQAQADMYKYVIEQYFEKIPAAQRYGITMWSPTDSPANSSWRAGEPIGLWTESFVRKLAYKAVAEALKAGN